MATRKKSTHGWKAGQSGNPKGRPPGTGEVARLRESIAAHVPDIIKRLVKAAKDGDIQAARLLLERTVAPLKAMEPTQVLALPDGPLTDQGRAVLAAAAAGTLTPGQASALLASIGALARITELDELERRLRALEQAQNSNPQ